MAESVPPSPDPVVSGLAAEPLGAAPSSGFSFSFAKPTAASQSTIDFFAGMSDGVLLAVTLLPILSLLVHLIVSSLSKPVADAAEAAPASAPDVASAAVRQEQALAADVDLEQQIKAKAAGISS